jgi:peroxiredoxin
MNAWAEDQGIAEDSMIKFMADPYSLVTTALDMQLTHPGPKAKGLVDRCKRHALYVVDGVVEIKRVAEAPDDPAGDDVPDVTLAEAMIEAIEAWKKNGRSDEL